MLFLLVVWLIHAFWSRVAKRKEEKARRERSGPESKKWCGQRAGLPSTATVF
jgi:hypothetical protein